MMMKKILTLMTCGMLLLAPATVSLAEENNAMLLKEGGEGPGALFNAEARKQAGVPEDIAKYIWDMQKQLTTWRSDLHKIPEIGHKEVETHAYLMKALTDMGYKPRKLGPSTGIVVDLPGEDTTFTIGVRGDIDALPITEANDGRAYRSTKEGFMHACGHDAHTTIVLGVAKAYADGKVKPPCNIRLIFQPAEELGTGALEMIEAGVLDGVDVIIGLHSDGTREWGTVGISEVAPYAYATAFRYEVTGLSAHGGAYPEQGKDALLTAANIVVQLQSIVSRNIAPADAGVIHVGTFQSGTAVNIVADKAVITGTTRAESKEIHELFKKRMAELAKGTEISTGMPVKYEIIAEAPGLEINPTMYKIFNEVANKVIGKANVDFVTRPGMGAEDFAYFSQEIPGFFGFFGVLNTEKGITFGLHTPEFDMDERALVVGTALQLANIKALAEYHKKGGKF
jgi:amidohydrolase